MKPEVLVHTKSKLFKVMALAAVTAYSFQITEAVEMPSVSNRSDKGLSTASIRYVLGPLTVTEYT